MVGRRGAKSSRGSIAYRSRLRETSDARVAVSDSRDTHAVAPLCYLVTPHPKRQAHRFSSTLQVKLPGVREIMLTICPRAMSFSFLITVGRNPIPQRPPVFIPNTRGLRPQPVGGVPSLNNSSTLSAFSDARRLWGTTARETRFSPPRGESHAMRMDGLTPSLFGPGLQLPLLGTTRAFLSLGLEQGIGESGWEWGGRGCGPAEGQDDACHGAGGVSERSHSAGLCQGLPSSRNGHINVLVDLRDMIRDNRPLLCTFFTASHRGIRQAPGSSDEHS